MTMTWLYQIWIKVGSFLQSVQSSPMCLARLSMAPITCTFEACRSSLSYYPRPSARFPLMSHTHPTSTLSDFQLIFDNALKVYKKRTKKDLLTHPLADRLKACDLPSSILTMLQEQLQKLDQSRRNDEKWLDPTVKVLHAFAERLGEDVGSVRFRT
jgi:hypothetical protein